MSKSVLAQVVDREVARIRSEWGNLPSGGIPDVERSVAVIVADVLDILSREGRFPAAIEPGLCWASGGVVWPNDVVPRCELRAGHAGAHECSRETMGGTATWTDIEVAPS